MVTFMRKRIKVVPWQLTLLFFGRQGESYGIVFEVAFVGAIAEGFVLGKATTADGNDLAAA